MLAPRNKSLPGALPVAAHTASRRFPLRLANAPARQQFKFWFGQVRTQRHVVNGGEWSDRACLFDAPTGFLSQTADEVQAQADSRPAAGIQEFEAFSQALSDPDWQDSHAVALGVLYQLRRRIKAHRLTVQ
jgi:hypothetical protein